MKKYLALFLTMVMGASVLAGCGGSDSAKTFTVGFDAEYPPYGYRTESGDYAGFDLDLAAEVCERNGWELVKQPIDWDAKDMELNSGAIDCIWNGFTMTGRDDEYRQRLIWQASTSSHRQAPPRFPLCRMNPRQMS